MTDTHALGSIEPVAWLSPIGREQLEAKECASVYPKNAEPPFKREPLYALPADYLERVRAMEEEIARLKSDRLYTIGFNDGYDTALSNREDGE